MPDLASIVEQCVLDTQRLQEHPVFPRLVFLEVRQLPVGDHVPVVLTNHVDEREERLGLCRVEAVGGLQRPRLVPLSRSKRRERPRGLGRALAVAGH